MSPCPCCTKRWAICKSIRVQTSEDYLLSNTLHNPWLANKEARCGSYCNDIENTPLHDFIGIFLLSTSLLLWPRNPSLLDLSNRWTGRTTQTRHQTTRVHIQVGQGIISIKLDNTAIHLPMELEKRGSEHFRYATSDIDESAFELWLRKATKPPWFNSEEL